MSMDFKVIECTTDDLDDNELGYNFIDYVDIKSTDYDCFYKIYQSSEAKRFKESDDGYEYDDLRVFDSIVYPKDTLLEMIKQYNCDLKDQLEEIIEKSEMDYIILQLF